MKLSRRLFLAGLSAASCGLPSEEGPASPDFPLGVASGDADADGALVWTRYDGRDAVQLEWWKRDDPTTLRTQPLTPRDGGFCITALEGLDPGTWWSFAFSTSSARSDEGHFRTALADDTLEPLRFGASSCSRQNYPLTPFLRAASEVQCDAFLMLGDTVYADGADDLPSYREKWNEALARRPNRLLRASTSLVSTWDDHEIINDASGDRLDPARVAAARQATFEHQPWRADGQMPQRLWRSLRWGRTAELFVLDCRSERNHATGEYLSRAQLDWLKAGLANSPATFKLILNSVPITAYPGAFFQTFAADRWEGFPAQRTEILDFIDSTPTEGVLWLTGDFHMGVAGRTARDGVGARQLEIAVGPAGNFPNPSLSYPAGPQFDFATAHNNFTTLELDPASRTVRVQFFDGGSRTLFDRTYPL